MKTRTDLLNHLAEKYQLKRYLEIGVQVRELNFDKIKCLDKVGVDPDPKANADFALTSDQFFETVFKYSGTNGAQIDTDEAKKFMKHFVYNKDVSKHEVSFGINFDLIFIDGLHTAEQVQKDFENSLKILSHRGFIVLHDCNPLKEEHTIVPRPTPTGHWHGDVYKFASELGRVHDCFVTVDTDCGCGVWRNGQEPYDPLVGYPIFWNYFSENRKELLNLISWEDFIQL